MFIGKSVRLERIFDRNTHKTIIVPMDHGVTVGPIEGLVDMRDAVDQCALGGANAVLMHKGLPRCSHRGKGKDVGLILHLSGSTSMSPFPNAKTLVASVEDGLRIGADAVSVHVNLGDETEKDMLAQLGQVTSKAAEWGMPVLAMMYARGPKIADGFDAEVVAHCARVGEEVGADVVKVVYTGDVDSFAKVVAGVCIPVVIAGGPKMDKTEDILRMAHEADEAGGKGLSIGRNIFQHADSPGLLRALEQVVHHGMSVAEAVRMVKA